MNSGETPQKGIEGYTCLIVDNNQANVSLLFEYLRTCGLRVLVARDGESAIQRARLANPDIILLDVLMPGLDGFETCRRLKSEPATRDIPVLFMTGLAEPEEKVRGFEAGGVDYLVKPLQLVEVRARLTTHLKLRTLVKELQSANAALNLKANYLTTSHRVGQQIIALLDLEELLGEISQLICKQFDYELVGIWLADEAAQVLRLAASYNREDRPFETGEISLSASQNPIVVAFGKGQIYRAEDLPMDFRAELAIGLKAGNQNLGVLDIQKPAPDTFQDEEILILQALASQVAIAIRNAQLYQLEKQRRRELESSNQELGTFDYSISHDLRAPLRAIDGYSHILQEEYLDFLPQDGQEMLQRVGINVRRMGQLIDDLLEFSRMGRRALNKTLVHTSELVEQCWIELQAETAERQIDFQLQALPDCLADASLLKQVWFNLIANAIKYTRNRERARIEIGCLSSDSQNSPVYYIQDNGAGFDMQYASKLFQVFQRLHSSNEFEGTGVGLAIVQRILHRHGGRIWAEAGVEQGATFYFTLS